MSANLRVKNFHNRILAKIGDVMIEKLNYYRWNYALKFLDKYEEKKKKRNLEGKETPPST